MKRLIKFILAKVLVLLGFSSCLPFITKAEYGTPYAEFEVKGQVKNELNEPIKGIKVSVINSSYSENTTLTDENGNYEIECDIMHINDIEGISFVDVDGELNGEYSKAEILAEDMNIIHTEEGDGWDNGDYEATVNVTLKESIEK